MDFLDLAAQRYSVRKFLDRPVEKETIEQILKAGHLAPTACNLQPQKIFVLESTQAMEKLRACTKCHFDAPMAMLVCCDKRLSWKRKFDGKDSGEIDASIVTTHMMLAAAALGVGTTWVMYFDAQAVRERFALEEDVEPVAILVMGYPAPDAQPYPGHGQFRPAQEIVKIL